MNRRGFLGRAIGAAAAMLGIGSAKASIRLVPAKHLSASQIIDRLECRSYAVGGVPAINDIPRILLNVSAITERMGVEFRRRFEADIDMGLLELNSETRHRACCLAGLILTGIEPSGYESANLYWYAIIDNIGRRLFDMSPEDAVKFAMSIPSKSLSNLREHGAQDMAHECDPWRVKSIWD